VENGKNIAIVDTSAECHMPDVLEMPYTPKIIGAVEEIKNLNAENSANNLNDGNAENSANDLDDENGENPTNDEKTRSYRLAGNTCLAGDIIGDYRFENPLKVGDRLTLCDMAIYSMVKNNTFNGVKLPAIVLKKKNGELEIVKEFGYEDFKRRI
jgi:carboxynorspermidine decarboxylase